MNFIKHQQNETQQVLIASNAKSASPSISHCGASFTVKASTAVVDNLGECDYKISYSPTGAEPGIFVWGGQVATLIYLSRQLHTHT